MRWGGICRIIGGGHPLPAPYVLFIYLLFIYFRTRSTLYYPYPPHAHTYFFILLFIYFRTRGTLYIISRTKILMLCPMYVTYLLLYWSRYNYVYLHSRSSLVIYKNVRYIVTIRFIA